MDEEFEKLSAFEKALLQSGPEGREQVYQHRLLRRGVTAWNQWRGENPEVQPNLSGMTFHERMLLNGVNLSGADMYGALFVRGADLRQANLSGADLSNAYLAEADLREAELTGANLTGTELTGANLTGTDLTDANLTGTDLRHATLVKTCLKRANLWGCAIHGISAWNVDLEGAIQRNLIITDRKFRGISLKRIEDSLDQLDGKLEPIITTDDLELAQFIYLLLNHKKLRAVINVLTERGVLLLGRFDDGGMEVLQAIAKKLREYSYLPIIFDFERPLERDYTETVKTLAGLSHFVIADLSGPSIPKELEAIVPHYKIPFAFICQAHVKPFAMSSNLFGYPWVLRPALLFSTVEDLLAKLPTRAIEPAEEMAEKTRRAKEKTLDELFSSE